MCYSTGSVTGGNGSTALGGLCGYSYGSISNCYATGSVIGGDESEYLGGLCGYGGSISNCYSLGSVQGGINSSFLGGLCGYSDRIIGGYFLDPNEGGGPDNGHGTPLTDNEMKQQSSFADWDFINESVNGTSSWWIISPGEYPSLYYFDPYFVPYAFIGQGTAQNPYLIYDHNDLGAICQHPDQHYRLQNNLDLAGINWSVAVIPNFGGVFDGNDHTIYNLHISGGSSLGLIGVAKNNAIILSLGLENVNITGWNYSRYFGGLCGRNYKSDIINCHSSGLVTSGNDSEYLGGLCGYNSDSSINNCYSSGSVIGGDDSDFLGGLCGANFSCRISNCYFMDTAGPDRPRCAFSWL